MSTLTYEYSSNSYFQDLAKDKKLFIAMPIYGGNTAFNCFIAILGLQKLMIEAKLNHRFEFLTTESLITRGRNTLVEKFLSSDYTHFLFIDADLQFNPDLIFRFFEFNKSIIGGVYPKKQINWNEIKKACDKNVPIEDLKFYMNDFVLNHITDDPEIVKGITEGKEIKIEPKQEQGFIQVAEIGTGFLMLKREVFTNMLREFPETYIPEEDFQKKEKRNVPLFFDTMLIDTPFGRRFLSEDYAFCYKARKCGYDIWADVSSNFGHGGFNVWYGTYNKSSAVEIVS